MSKLDDNTSMGGSNKQFPATEWADILGATRSKAILSELYGKYWRPVYLYLRRKGFDNETAKDLVQGFFTERVLGQEFLQKADRTKGKFRTFLLTAVANYATDVHRASNPTQQITDRLGAADGGNDPETEFNRSWAENLLQEVLEELQLECQQSGKDKHWAVFKAWLLEPSVDSDKTRMSDICSAYGIANRDKAYNMIANIKGRFRAILRRHLCLLVSSEQEVDVELANFIDIFSRSSTR